MITFIYLLSTPSSEIQIYLNIKSCKIVYKYTYIGFVPDVPCQTSVSSSIK